MKDRISAMNRRKRLESWIDGTALHRLEATSNENGEGVGRCWAKVAGDVPSIVGEAITMSSFEESS